MWAIKGSAADVIRYVTNTEKTMNENYRTDPAFNSLENVLEYTADKMKTERQLFVTGVLCDSDPKTAAEQFRKVKERYRKKGGVVCYHGYQAFNEGEVTPELAHEIGIKLAEELWGDRFQVLVTTHINTGKIHNHFCLNSVGVFDGKRYVNSHADYKRMRETSDRLCREYGLEVVSKDNNRNESYNIWQEDQNDYSGTKKHLYEDLDAVLEYVTSFEQFKREIQNRGYVLEYRGSFLRIRPDEGKKFYRLDRLGEGYTVEDIRDRCRQNYYDNSRGEYDYYSLPRRDRSKGIAGLYGYYVYLLKIYPKMDLSLSREVYVSLREESRKAKMYSEEAVLLDDNKIKTADDMRRFTQSVSDQFRELAIKRSKLRNKLRRMTDSEAMQPIKDEMYALTDEMKELRRKMKLCEDIARRSGAVEAVVNTIDSYGYEKENTQQRRNER